jgi:hypothetical protein
MTSGWPDDDVPWVPLGADTSSSALWPHYPHTHTHTHTHKHTTMIMDIGAIENLSVLSAPFQATISSGTPNH